MRLKTSLVTALMSLVMFCISALAAPVLITWMGQEPNDGGFDRLVGLPSSSCCPMDASVPAGSELHDLNVQDRARLDARR